MSEIEKLKESILKDAPRFTEKDKFIFSCHKGVSCFTECCADVNIFLTPYDILRMKNSLDISSEEFLARHTLVPFNEKQQMPVVVLKMQDDEHKRCPFVSDEGCTIYEDRPWSCRMYPLGFASPKEGTSATETEFYFLMEEAHCKGFADGQELSVRQWLEDQGILEYNEMGEFFKDISLHEDFQKGETLEPDKMEMFYMVCYNLDKFRRFVFESSFLKTFEIEPELVESIRSDDVELMKFGFKWLRYALFGEPLIEIREDVRERKSKSMGNLTGL
jgi:Fe-S-cluster containining protein